MIVNGVDLHEKYKKNVTWLSQTIQPRNVITYTDWLDTGIDPVKIKPNRYTDFEIYIDMLIKGNSKEECEWLMSSMLSEFDSGVVKLDDMEFQYTFDFKSENRELVKRWLYHYELTLTGYNKLGVRQSTDFTGTDQTFTVAGTDKTPLVLTVSSNIGLNSLTIEGLTEQAFTISEVQKDSKIVIDGENCTITENGENILGKTDLWEFPQAEPGSRTLKLSSVCTANLSYYPRYR